MKTVAVIVQDGFAPFEFGVACEAFGLDRTDDGIPNFDFRIVTPNPGVVQSKLGFSLNVDNDLAFAYEADLVVVSPTPSEWWGRTDPRVIDVVRDAAARGAWLLSICSGSFILGAAGVLDGRKATRTGCTPTAWPRCTRRSTWTRTCSTCRTAASSRVPARPPGSMPAFTFCAKSSAPR